MTLPRVADRWRAAPNLIWTRFDDSDDWVVYDPASADVHLLTAAAHRLWTFIADAKTARFEDLVAVVASGAGREPDEELAGIAREALAAMDESGLLWPVWS